MKKARQFLLVILLIATYTSHAQVAVNTDGSNPDGSAMLEVKSNAKGMLIPRMTRAQIEAIASPADGLMVYNTTEDKLFIYRDASSLWVEVAFSTGKIRPGGFICGFDLFDLRDEQYYSTVQIGTQCWMAENINIGSRIDGYINQSNNSIIEKYCYNNDESNCDTYGGLYQWEEAMQYVSTEGAQGICPTGWHLPTDAEWCTLENYVDAGTVACNTIAFRGTDVGGNLKEAGISHWSSPNTGATNSSGFTCLAAGWRRFSGSFEQLNAYAFLWSSSESGSDAWWRQVRYNLATVGRDDYLQSSGLSVRCVKN